MSSLRVPRVQQVFRPTRCHARHGAAVALAGWLAACGGASDVGMSATAEGYLDEMIDVMQAHSINRNKIEWASFRSSVHHAAGSAVTVADLSRDAIPTALRLLGDHRSYYTASNGSQVLNPDRLSCTDPPAPVVTAPSGIGYVKVAPFSGGTGESEVYATSMQHQFEDQDAPELAGWIIDVRGIGGGNMYGLIGGLVTVLGEGEFGAWVDPDGKNINWWGYRQGQVTYAGYPYFYAWVHELIRPNPKVAVLTDCSVASSGEAVVISFRGRPNTRSFGTPTYGASTGYQSFTLSDGGTLVLIAWTMEDRNRMLYGGPVVPDEVIRDPAQAVQRAIAWLTE
jgi:carboxyl-terminal processing protease